MRALFEEALTVPAASRAAYLVGRCADPVVRGHVERLLVAHSDEGGVLHIPVSAIAEKLALQSAPMDVLDWVGREIGGVRLIDLLGQGGSAVVFRGEKVQHGVTQIVAVKLFRQVLLTDAEVRRFRRERAAMAQLAHPNIARLIDGGITVSSMPYIVLEFVDGLSITDHAREARLPVRDRLQMFIDVCRAVDAAHRALIVHRDIKPSNVLVGRDGCVKLLDFGIAKFLNAEDDVTEAGHCPLTPAYAAPEQFHGGAITTATDVYSLGVLLGELLTGQRPAAATRYAPGAMFGQARGPAALPAAAQRARQSPRGDLDNIIVKALSAEVESRYASAGALADDLLRFLESRPVLAHPPSRRYRMRKFYARHRLVVGISASLCFLIVSAVAAALWQARVATAQSALARTEAAQSQATRDFMVGIFRMAEPAGARATPATVIDVTEAALGRLDTDPQMNPRVRLDLKTQLGAVLRGQSRMARATTVARQAYEEGSRVFGRADALVVDAGLELVRTLIIADDYAQAHAVLAAMEPDVRMHDGDRSVEYEVLASKVAATLGNATEALAHLARGTASCDERCSAGTRFNLLVAEGNTNGVFQRDEASAAAWEKAVALARTTNGPVHATVATALNGLAGTYRRLGRFDDARRAILEVIDIDDRIQVPAMHWQRALHWNQLGNVYFSLGDYEAALDALQRALLIARTVNGEDEGLATDIHSIGVVFGKLGQLDQAVEHLRDALRRRTEFSGAHGRDAAFSRLSLAHMLALKGEFGEAMPLFAEAVGDLAAAGEGSQGWLFGALRTQGRALLWTGKPAQALAVIDEALAIADRFPGASTEPGVLAAQVTRGVALMRMGRNEEAALDLQQAVQRLQELDAEYHSQAYASLALGLIAAQGKRCEVARQHLAQGRSALAREPFTYSYLADSESALEAAVRAACDLRI